MASKLFLSITFLFVLVSSVLVASVDASSVMWSRIYEIGPVVEANSIIETSDGNYAIAGGLYTPADFWLVKIDESGNVQWNMTYGGEEKDVARSLVQTFDGGYALAGFTESFGQGEEDFWLIKTDADGNMQWNRTFGGPDPEMAYSLIETSDGGYAMAGYVGYSGPRGLDFWVVKTDSYGNLVWNQTYGGADAERAYSLVEAPDGGYVVAGGSRLVKIDSQGRTEWDQKYFVGVARSLVKVSVGGYAVAGDGFLIKTDSYGNMEWNHTHGGRSLFATSDGGYAFVSGLTLTKTDAQGNVEWNEGYETNRHPAEEWTRLNSVIETSDGGYAIAGDIFDWFIGDGLIWVIKTDDYGIIPEFPAWTPLLITLVAILVVAVIYRRNLQNRGRWKK
jgi:hypothetical protein